MIAANYARNKRGFEEHAGIRTAFVLRISFTTLRQVESHVR
jgi:hypothetical protein